MAKLNKTELAKIVYNLSTTGYHVHNPYHNLIHCNQVYEACVNLLTMQHLEPSDELIWASLYHDYNHSGGSLVDTINVQNAIDGVKKDIEEFYSTYPDQPPVNIDTIESLIKCTTYIGYFPNEPKTYEEQVLRDADLMSVFADHGIAVLLMNGLYKEIHNKVPDLTKEKFAEQNYEFLTNAKYYTEHANDLVEQFLMMNLERITPDFLAT